MREKQRERRADKGLPPFYDEGGSSISVEVRPLASKVGAKHLAKSSSPFAGMIPSKGKVFLQNQEAVKGLNSVRPPGKDQFIHIS